MAAEEGLGDSFFTHWRRMPMSERIPRLEMEQLEATLAEALRPRVERLGYLGEFFKCTGHQPAALRSFMEFTETSKAGLPKNLVELVALTVAGIAGNKYERHQHERLCLKLGFTRDWVAAVNGLAPDTAKGLDDNERAVQRLVIGMVERNGHGVRAELEAAIGAIGHAQVIAVMMVVGRYVTHALIVNALELAPPVPSIFEARAG